ncbi:MCP four helix bundle domain-containing protein [Spirulina subsalsa FACHB-351]|uniref:MCP four helix bundle domain-containing protein n=1 Tax=Spirulina subsalsa FACHB-351 TaxID=234711 RepID=A0ABT3L9Z7_9CYAN|nr:methyl-accepting chemotaxis protein [Spirulina subsalsa]MCW6037795.1 MCP four helix bundle domain-containing protein [Spirulina subsalsa FACHB-351]
MIQNAKKSNNLKRRLQNISIFPALLLGIVGFSSLVGFWSINQKVGTIYDDRVVPLKQLKLVSDAYAVSIVDAANKANSDRITMAEALGSIQAAMSIIEGQWQQYKKTDLTREEQALVLEIENLFRRSDQMVYELEEVLQAGNRDRLMVLASSVYDVIDPITLRLNELMTLQLEVAEEERNGAAALYQMVLLIFIPVLVLTIVIVLSPLKKVLSQLLTAALEETIENLAKASSEIATVTEQQERVAAQQAVSVQETTTTMHQLEVSSQQSSEQAQLVAQRAQEVLELSQQGNEAVNGTMQGMQELQERVEAIAQQADHLNHQARQIGMISQLVGEVANQTNMLALNASIEAVRAGEHGKGFSVVATEIRKLAEQSQESVQKINHLVQSIQKSIQTTVNAAEVGSSTVQTNVQLAEVTANSFQGVTLAIEEVVASSQQIALSVQQEASAIQQIMQTMNDLSRVSQETVSGITQTKQGTQQLNETAFTLRAMI